MMDVQNMAEVLAKAAKAGGAVLRDCFYDRLHVEVKQATSPFVTKADKESELEIRKMIEASFPNHSIIGEEFPAYHPDGKPAPIQWVIDPLDGTSAFLSGLPTFVVLIGIWQENQPLLGAIYQPLTDTLWVGGKDYPTKRNDSPIIGKGSASHPKILATTSPENLGDEGKKTFDALRDKTDTIQYGGDGHLYASLAEGRIWCIVEEGLAWHDVAALVPVIEGAGGRIRDFDGQPILSGKASYQVVAEAPL